MRTHETNARVKEGKECEPPSVGGKFECNSDLLRKEGIDLALALWIEVWFLLDFHYILCIIPSELKIILPVSNFS